MSNVPNVAALAAGIASIVLDAPMEMAEIGLDRLLEDNPRTDYGSEEEQRLLEASIARELHYPVLVRPHPTMAGYFFIVDGHRRCRAARNLGWEKIRALPGKAGATESDIRQVQLRIDLHHKKLTPGETYTAIREIEAANPGLNNNQLGELIQMGLSMLSRYRGLSRLTPAAMEAFMAGKFGLKAADLIAQRPPGQQQKALEKAIEGATVAELAEDKRGSDAPATSDAPRVKAIQLILESGVTVTFKGKELTLDAAIAASADADRELARAKKGGHDARTLAALMKKRKGVPTA